MHADKTMWSAISQYCRNTYGVLRAWYFGGEVPRGLTIPLFLFAAFVAVSILAFIPATLLSLYTMGGLFLIVLGIGPALVFLLCFAALYYLSLPVRLWGWLEAHVSARPLRWFLLIALMLAGWLAVGFLQLGYGYLIQSALG